jgi:hypothetical protein
MKRFLLCAALLTPLMWCTLARAADPDEVASLKARINELEQQVRDLKQQLARQPKAVLPHEVRPYYFSSPVVPPARIHPDARPFEFNGRTYYIMPLERR